jgi:Ca2+-transporting ATPase
MVPRFNLPLVAVVAVSVGIQVLSQNNAFLGRLLKTAPFPLMDSLGLLAVGAVPLAVLEIIKAIRSRRAQASAPR